MYEHKPAFVILTFEPTKEEFLYCVSDANNHIKITESRLKTGNHLPESLGLSAQKAGRHWWEVRYADDPKEAMETYLANYQSFDLFKNVGLPNTPGVFKIIDKKTGAFFIGRSGCIRKGVSNFWSGCSGARKTQIDERMMRRWTRQREQGFSVQFIRTVDKENADKIYKELILSEARNPLLANDPKTKAKGRQTNGVYKLTSTNNGHFYVGSSKDVYHRISHHKVALKGGYHNSPKMTAHYAKYGWDFKEEFYILDTRQEAYRLEQQLINEGIERAECLNSSKDSISPISGVFISDEARAKGVDKLRREELTVEDYVGLGAKASKLAWEKRRSQWVTPERSAQNSKQAKAMHEDPVFRKRRALAMAAYNSGGRFTYLGETFDSGKDAAAKTGIGVNRIRKLVQDPDCKEWYITIPDDRKAEYEQRVRDVEAQFS